MVAVTLGLYITGLIKRCFWGIMVAVTLGLYITGLIKRCFWGIMVAVTLGLYITGLIKRCFWGIMVAVTLGLLIFNFYTITDAYFSYNVDVNIRLKHETELIFPAITICNMNPIRKSMIMKSSLMTSNDELYSSLLASSSTTSKTRYKRQAAGK